MAIRGKEGSISSLNHFIPYRLCRDMLLVNRKEGLVCTPLSSYSPTMIGNLVAQVPFFLFFLFFMTENLDNARPFEPTLVE